MKGNPDKQTQAARDRMDRNDAKIKAQALIRRIGDRQPTAQQLQDLADLRNAINGGS